MEEVKRIRIDKTDRDYMQFLHFEKNSYQEILGFILLEKQKGYNYSKDNYEHFMNEFKEANYKWSVAFSSLIAQYAPEYHGNDDYIAEINFDTCEVIICKRG